MLVQMFTMFLRSCAAKRIFQVTSLNSYMFYLRDFNTCVLLSILLSSVQFRSLIVNLALSFFYNAASRLTFSFIVSSGRTSISNLRIVFNRSPLSMAFQSVTRIINGLHNSSRSTHSFSSFTLSLIFLDSLITIPI